MDVVLECLDTFVLDHFYAKALPLRSSPAVFDPISTLTAGFKGYDNDTFAAQTGLAQAVGKSAWQWEPASPYLSFEPSEAAWMSRWDRDNIWRQAISLYAITW